jgi:hypothetical protein
MLSLFTHPITDSNALFLTFFFIHDTNLNETKTVFDNQAKN